jgi:Glycosyltransferase like family
MPGLPARRVPVSIVTVFNDLEMRRACLDRSIEAHRHEAPDVEYLPIDNSSGAFATAGAALNHGAAQARHDYVVFVHQDVYLHSLAALEEAAGVLADDDGIGLLGAIGVTSAGRFFGRVRDRVMLLGDPTARPLTVDSVDEVLFVISRRTLEREPLADVPDLAWHAYAVEYGLRLGPKGLRVCAVDMPLTHNSLTVNLDRLDVAYGAIAAMYPDAMPIITPGGRVGGTPRVRDRISVLGAHRWRYRWLRESRDAHAGRRSAGGSPCVLSDIRLDVDDVIAGAPDRPVTAISVDHHPVFADERPGPLTLPRAGRPIMVTSRPVGEVAEAVAGLPSGTPVLLTNLTLDDVGRLAPQLPSQQRVLGYRTSIGYWMLLGVPGMVLPAAWRSPQATPLGMRALSG